MTSNSLKIILALFIIATVASCEKDSNKPTDKVYLLTNNSAKSWYLQKIELPKSGFINMPACIRDDELKFQNNGHCIMSNNGTVLSSDNNIFTRPPYCKDTVNVIDSAIWRFNSNFDSLFVTFKEYSEIGRIIKLTSDSLIVERTISPILNQNEYYVTKE